MTTWSQGDDLVIGISYIEHSESVTAELSPSCPSMRTAQSG